MFSKLKRLLGNVTVKVKDKIVYCDGIPADVISGGIKSIWGTTRIEKGLFNNIDENSFSFNEFFCVDVVYALNQVITSGRRDVPVRTLAKVRDLIIENTWLANSSKVFPSKLNYAKLDNFHFKPLDFQQSFFHNYDQITQQYQLNGILLAAAAGSGKTYMSIVLTECLEADQVIVVSPNNALDRVWVSTLQTLFKIPPTYWMSKGGLPFTGKEKFQVLNYEYLAKFTQDVPKLKGGKTCIILDESHNFNTHDSIRTQLFIDLCQKIKGAEVLWLSGTPIKALSTEAIPLLRSIDPRFTKDTEERFKKIFGVSSERGADILKNRLGFSSFKVEKKQLDVLAPIFKEMKIVIPDGNEYTLESVTKQMVAYTLERVAYYKTRERSDREYFDKCLAVHQRQLKTATDISNYDFYLSCLKIVIRTGGDARVARDEVVYCNKYENTKILPTLAKELKADFKNVKSIIKYTKLKIQGECLGRIVGRARINAHIAMCEHVNYCSVIETTVKKTVVFTSFVQVIEKLQTLLPDLGLAPLFVYAKTNSSLSSIINEFEKNENKNPLVATYASLSTAVPLVMADTMIMIDSPFRDYQLQQTVSRISRIGATTQTYVYTCVLDTGDKPNISSRSFDILKWSQSQIAAITGVVSPFEISDDLEQASFALEGLEKKVSPAPINAVPSFMQW